MVFGLKRLFPELKEQNTVQPQTNRRIYRIFAKVKTNVIGMEGSVRSCAHTKYQLCCGCGKKVAVLSMICTKTCYNV